MKQEVFSNTEESQLVKWFNSKVNPRKTKLVNFDQLVLKTTEMVGQLRDKINWSRYLTNSNLNWNATPVGQVMQTLLENYRNEWIRLAVKYHRGSLSHSLPVTSSHTLVGLITGSDQPATSFLATIFLMDRAKIMGVVGHDPPLFHTNSSLFESQQVLSQFCLQLTLGSVTKLRSELKSIGYTVEWRDSVADSQHFPIVQLNYDICDGLRIAKMIQILFPGDFRFLLVQLKYPATRNADRISNFLMLSKISSKLQKLDSKWTWSKENLIRIALGYREETLEALKSLIRVEWALKIKQHYLPNLDKVIQIQIWIKNLIQTRQIRSTYLMLRETTIWVQRKFCANRLARMERKKFLKIKKSVLEIQRWYRRKRNWAIVRTYLHQKLQERQRASIVIQRYWRGYSTRLQQYQYQPSLINCVQSLYEFQNNRKSDTIGMRTLKIVANLSKRLNYNSEGSRIINEQLVDQLEQLHRFVYYSKEIRVQLAQQTKPNKHHVLAMLVTLAWQLNRSEQHKRIAFLLIALINFITDASRQWQPPGTLVPALVHLTGSYLNYAPLVSPCLHLLGKLARHYPELCEAIRKDHAWPRLQLRILHKYGRCESDNCQSCHLVYSYTTDLNRLLRI